MNKEVHAIEDYNYDARKQSGNNAKQQSFDFRLILVGSTGLLPCFQMRDPSVVSSSKAEHLNRFLGKINILKIIFSY